MNTKEIIAQIQNVIDSSNSFDSFMSLQELIEPDTKESMMSTYLDMSKHCGELLEELNLLRIQMLALETMINELPQDAV